MASGKKLNPLDWTFLAAETRESMMHVGSLMPFSPPPGGSPDLLRELMDEVRQQAKACPPWNYKLRFPNFPAHPMQSWVEDADFDVEYHIRRSALPAPGDERELGILVSRLHSHNIDFHRPPWEVHFIEGLEGGRFALYFKVHHALIDGYTGIQLMSHALSTSADDRDTPMFFAAQARARKASDSAKAPTLDVLMEAVRSQWGASRNITKALTQTAQSKKTGLVAPMAAPKSIINRKISRNRRFATQSFSVSRMKQIAKAHKGTLNDLVLATCSGALRRWMLELDALPAKPMTAMIPVNIRPKDDPGGGNAVGTILASLATDIEDPLERTRAIIESTRRAKAQLEGMSQRAIMQYSSLLMTPMLLSQIPGAVGRIQPAFNLVISNVPGPRQPLYFRGFSMDAYYPISIPFHGYGLNITVVSYIDQLNFGFIGCRDTVPHLQRLAVYSAEALDELEKAA